MSGLNIVESPETVANAAQETAQESTVESTATEVSAYKQKKERDRLDRNEGIVNALEHRGYNPETVKGILNDMKDPQVRSLVDFLHTYNQTELARLEAKLSASD